MNMKDYLAHYQPKPLGEKRRYAVLLPLVFDKGSQSWQVLYHIRSEAISQPGEVAFPGGRVEEGESYREAAIRETCEELHLQPDVIEIWGEIDYFVYQDRSIHCFVGQLLVEDWRQLTPNEEVQRLFTVRLDTLLTTEPTYYSLKAQFSEASNFPFSRIRGGRNYHFGHLERTIPFYNGLTENIWGMTAMFTHRFSQIVRDFPLF